MEIIFSKVNKYSKLCSLAHVKEQTKNAPAPSNVEQGGGGGCPLVFTHWAGYNEPCP